MSYTFEAETSVPEDESYLACSLSKCLGQMPRLPRPQFGTAVSCSSCPTAPRVLQLKHPAKMVCGMSSLLRFSIVIFLCSPSPFPFLLRLPLPLPHSTSLSPSLPRSPSLSFLPRCPEAALEILAAPCSPVKSFIQHLHLRCVGASERIPHCRHGKQAALPGSGGCL